MPELGLPSIIPIKGNVQPSMLRTLSIVSAKSSPGNISEIFWDSVARGKAIIGMRMINILSCYPGS